VINDHCRHCGDEAEEEIDVDIHDSASDDKFLDEVEKVDDSDD